MVRICTPGYALIEVRDDDVEVKGEELEDVILSYFITIHKSQGSEFDEVIIVLPEAPKILLTKNLLYTAVTRAKKKVTIIQVGNSIKNCVLNKTKEVKTGLGIMLGAENG